MVMMEALALSACHRPLTPAGAEQRGHGRYSGVGLYSPQVVWTKMVRGDQAQSKDEAVAKPIDDQVIIVVEDSTTGEVRACGDLTGYCVGLNPWSRPLGSSQTAPIRVTEHVKPFEESSPPATAPK